MNESPAADDHGPRDDGDPRDYARLRAWFDAALAIPEVAREAWLESQPMTPAQRARLRRLLEAHGADHGYLETPAVERAAKIGTGEPASDDGASFLGRRIGGFRLTRVLGRGGMAMVFLGEREGSDFAQRAAVKLLRRGLFSELEQRLFQRERRALAALSHAGIARLIDGGVTDAGIPYLVMEYVEGVPITRHAAELRLGVPERLRLFVRVCAAAAAAHQRLIVHRDIKPSNILVGADGEAKLLDFGIAKLLDEDLESATGTGLPALTPGYAAPEQYAGGPISTATDVYALGVLLHELLLGERPHDTRRRPSAGATESSVATTRLPLAPSTLRDALRGDLDNIVLRALAAEPELRYANALDLAEDIERHLRREPVAAHPPSAWYRARKFAARHRGGIAMLLAAVLAALGVALWQANVARAQAHRAAEVQTFVEALFQPLEDGRAASRAPSLAELLQRGRERIDQHPPGDPRVHADLLAMFARIGDSLGDTMDNRLLAASAWRANDEAYGPHDLRSLEAHGLYARVLRKLGDYDAALAEYATVRDAMRSLGIDGQPYARLLDSMSIALMDQGIDPQRAIALKREALRLREADAQSSPDDLATGYNNLGAAHQYAGDYAQALDWYEKSLVLDRRHHGDSLATATTLMNIGQAQSLAGHWRKGATNLREARAMFARIPIERHPNLVSLLIRLCGVEGDLELAQAGATCDAAVDMAREVHGPAHAQHAVALARAARAQLAAGDTAAANETFGHARAVAADAGGDARRTLRIIDGAQVRLWWLEGDFASLRDAATSSLVSSGRAQSALANALALAALACRHAPSSSCDPLLVEQARNALAGLASADNAQLLVARLALAEIAWLDGEPGAPAALAIDGALARAEAELGASHSLIVQGHLLLAALHRQAGDAEAAGRHSAQAESGVAGLLPTHPLRRRLDMYRAVP